MAPAPVLNSTSCSVGQEEVLDALIVGAGFCGLAMLHNLRRQGFNVKIHEGGGDLGGAWYWNRYPGARVDSGIPVYQFLFDEEADRKIWDDFEWQERFPDREEIMAYFHHVDKKLGFSKDIRFNTWVTSAHFDNERRQWLIRSKSDAEGAAAADAPSAVWAKYFILGAGNLQKPHMPQIKGIETFKGQLFHSARWPEHTKAADLRGKRVGIVGTGTSGVQVIQEHGPVAGHLTVFQRTPNMAIPMRQRWRGEPPAGRTNDDGGGGPPYRFPKPESFQTTYNRILGTTRGFDFCGLKEKWHDASPAEREAVFERLWSVGGVGFVGGYSDLLYDDEANDGVYAFWVQKVRARLRDPQKRDLLAPLVKPHAWATKRLSLEQTYYEVFNQPNVDIVNVRKSPIVQITPDGVETKNEGLIPLDALIFATGFDAHTGAILAIDIRNGSDQTLGEKWDSGVVTVFGMAVSDFPNMFILAGPQSPAGFVNAPVVTRVQCDWVANLLVAMRDGGKTRVEATKQSEEAWGKHMGEVWYSSLMPATDSWYQGANVPGKRRQPLSYYGTLPMYTEALQEGAKNNYQALLLS